MKLASRLTLHVAAEYILRDYATMTKPGETPRVIAGRTPRILLRAFILLFPILAVQCSRELQTPVAPKWDVDLTVPITDRTLTLGEMIERDTSSHSYRCRKPAGVLPERFGAADVRGRSDFIDSVVRNRAIAPGDIQCHHGSGHREHERAGPCPRLQQCRFPRASFTLPDVPDVIRAYGIREMQERNDRDDHPQ